MSFPFSSARASSASRSFGNSTNAKLVYYEHRSAREGGEEGEERPQRGRERTLVMIKSVGLSPKRAEFTSLKSTRGGLGAGRRGTKRGEGVVAVGGSYL